MYITFNEINSTLSGVVGGRIRIVEYYPPIYNSITRIPADGQYIHPAFSELYARNIAQFQMGQLQVYSGNLDVSIELDEYTKYLNECINYIRASFPQLSIECDDVTRMYNIWLKTEEKYNISNILNVTTKSNDIVITNLKNLWIPELDIGNKINKTQFVSSLKHFVPELNTCILMLDSLYEYAKENIMGNDPTILFESDYTVEGVSNFITSVVKETHPNLTNEQLVAVVNSPLNVDNMKAYYIAMGQRGFDVHVSKALLAYHTDILKATEYKVRNTLGLIGVDTKGLSLVPPTEMYLDAEGSKKTSVVSIM